MPYEDFNLADPAARSEKVYLPHTAHANLPQALKAEFPQRGTIALGDGAHLATGRLSLVGIPLPAGLTVNSIAFRTQTTAAGTPTNWWFSLFDQNRALLANTADQTTTAWGAGTFKQLALTQPHTTTYSGLYYAGIVMAATTVVSLVVYGGLDVFASMGTPVMSGSSNTGLTTPASFGPVGTVANALAGSFTTPWVGIA